MQKSMKIIKGLAILCLLCVLSCAIAFSEDNKTATKITQGSSSENNTSLLNASKTVSVKTKITQGNSSENNTSLLNASRTVGLNSKASLNILTGTSSVSWEDAVQNVVNALDSTGEKVKSLQVLKFDVKLEDGKIVAYKATVLLSY